MITPMTMGKLPMLLDMHRDECLGELRSRELLAYSHLVSVFRAQGELSKEKRKVLSEVQHLLSISLERHKAEVRRAVNDEVLYTIAEMLFGHNTQVEWAIEARRVVPLLPRAIPQVAYTAYATKMAQEYFNMNMKKPQPRDTAQFNSNKDLGLQSDDTDSEEEMTGLRYLSDDALPAALLQQFNTRGTPAQANRSEPANSVDATFNVLSHRASSSPPPAPPPASSCSSPGKQRKRQRSSSLEALVPQAVPLLLPPHSPICDPPEGETGEVQASATTSPLFAGPPPIKQARSGSGGVSMKVSVAGAAQRPTPATSSVSAQKVILVSTSGASGGGSSAVYQRPISVLKSGGSAVSVPPNRLPPAAPPVAMVPVMPVRPMQAVRPMSVGGATVVQTGPPTRPVGQGSGGLPSTTMAGWPSAAQPSGYTGQFPVASSILHSAPSTLGAGGGVGMVTRVRPRLTVPLSVPPRGGVPSQRQHRPVAPSQLHRPGALTHLHYTQQQLQPGQDSTVRVTQPAARTVGFESGITYGPMMSSGYSSIAVQQQQHAATLQARVSRTTDMTSAVPGGGMNRVVSVGGAVAGGGGGGGRFITRPASSEGGGGGQPQMTALASASHQHQQQQSLQGSIYHPSHHQHQLQQEPSPQQHQSPPVFVVTTNSSTITVVTRTVAPHNTLQQPGGSASQRVVTLNPGRSNSSSASSLGTTSSTTPLYRSSSLVAGSGGMGVRTGLGTITPTTGLKGSGGGEVCSTARAGGGIGGSISSISFGAFNRSVGSGGLHVTGGVGGGTGVGRNVTSSLRGPTTAAATGIRTSISGGASATIAAGRGVTLSSRGAGVRGAVQAVRGGGPPGGTVQAARVPAAGAMQALRMTPGGAVQAVRSAAASKSNVIVVHKGTTSATCCSTRDISTKITIGKNVMGDGGPRGVGAAGRVVGATPTLLRTTLQSAPDNRTGITLHASRVALDHQPKPVLSRLPTPPPPQPHQSHNTATPPPPLPPPPPQHQAHHTATPPPPPPQHQARHTATPPPPPPQHQPRHTLALPSTTQHQRRIEYFASSGTGPTDQLCNSSNGSDNSNSSDDSNSSNIVVAVGAERERRDGPNKEMTSDDLSVKDNTVTAAAASLRSSPATSPTPPSTTSSTHVTTISIAAVSTASVPRVSSLPPVLSTTTSSIDTPPVDASSCTVATTSESCSSSITLSSSSNFTSLQLPAPPVASFSSVCLSSQSSSSPNFSSSNSFTVGIEGPAPSLELDDDWLSSGVREELSTETTGMTDYTSNNLPDGQMQALEEAMEVLGRGDKEGARTLLLQAGIELLDSPADTSGGIAVGSMSSVTIAAPSHDPPPHVEEVVSHSPSTQGEQEGGGSSSRVQVVASRSAADYSDPSPAPTLVLTMEAPQSPLPAAGSSSPKDDEDDDDN